MPPGAWCDMIDNSVAGSVTVTAGSGLRIAGSTIGRLVAASVHGASDPLSSGVNVVCNTAIGGDLVVASSARSAPWNLSQCGGDTVKGSVTFHGNTQ